MTKKEKVLQKFRHSPESIKYSQLRNILLELWFIQIEAKWSHTKFKNKKLGHDIIIPVHNNDCKGFYKKQVYKILKDNSLI